MNMDQLLVRAKLQGLLTRIDIEKVTVERLYSILHNKNVRVIDRFKTIMPEATIFECHKIKACLLDLEKAGELDYLFKIIKKNNSEEDQGVMKKSDESSDITKSATKMKNVSKDNDIITPDKKGYGKYIHS